MDQFVHLHTHSAYSFLDGQSSLDDLVRRAVDLGMPALAITDHGNMHGALEFYEKARKAGIKPILGEELYMSEDIKGDPFHLGVLVQNAEGYRNLMKLSTRTWTERFHGKPKASIELLAEHSDGLICLSGCMGSHLATLARSSTYDEALHRVLETAEMYKDIFGDRYFLEIQDHKTREDGIVNAVLIEASRRSGIPLVVTNDSHYTFVEHAPTHELLLCVGTGSSIDNPNHFHFPGEGYHLKSAAEMAEAFGELPEAMRNTLRVAEMVDLEVELGRKRYPEAPVPEGFTPDSYLRELTMRGAVKRYGDPVPGEIRQRIDMELGLFSRKGFSSYFIIVQDFINWAKSQGIPVGPGRGSVGGSLVAYLIGITEVDPIRYDLYFERFLNDEREEDPDIDTDICYLRRGEVIDYVRRKYGEDHVGLIATFGTMAAKSAVRDVARALGRPYADGDRIARLIPGKPGTTFDDAMQVAEFAELYQRDASAREIIDHARLLEGKPRHPSVHAAGVIIAPVPLTEIVPLFVVTDHDTGEKVVATQYDLKYAQKAGCLKMDFLGLRNITVIDDTVRMLRERSGIEVKWDEVDVNDPKTYALLRQGDVAGVFQVEGSGFRQLLVDMKPDRIDDIIAVGALYRPGPMKANMHTEYVLRKHGIHPVTYLHPDLEPILRRTYGIIVYQEQVLAIARTFAGYTLGEADLLRRAMGHKIPEEMAAHRDKFLAGARTRGYSDDLATELFELMQAFAEYGFNAAHSTAYALITFRTAYLKAHHPVEYFTALLNSVVDKPAKLAYYLHEARRMGIEIHPVDVNRSQARFTTEGAEAIRYGMTGLKGVGDVAVERIVEARQDGAFKDLVDFLERVETGKVNRGTLEVLAKMGALDSLGGHRAQMLAALPEALKWAQNRGPAGQMDLFGIEDAPHPSLPQVPRFTDQEVLALEKEITGAYLSGHPLDDWLETLQVQATPIEELSEFNDRSRVRIGGLVTAVKPTITRVKQQPMAFVSIEDMTGTAECVVFPEPWSKFSGLLMDGQIRPVLVEGVLDLAQTVPKILVDSVQVLDMAAKSATPDASTNTDTDIFVRVRSLAEARAVGELATTQPGIQKAYLVCDLPDAPRRVIEITGRVRVTGELLSALFDAVGKDNVRTQATRQQ